MPVLQSIKAWWDTLSRLQKILAVLFIFGLITSRFYLLGQIPVGIHYDELVYLIQAKAFLLSGSDLIGYWQPWRFLSLTAQHSELTALVFAPGLWLFRDPLFAGRVVSALLGLTFPFLVGWLAWNLWQNKRLVWATVFVTAFNPWVWQFSRMSFDPLPGLWLFFLVAALLTSKKITTVGKWLIALLMLFAFFHYQGYKILLVPWVAGWSYYGWRFKKSLSRYWAAGLTVFAIGLFLVWYLVLLPSQGASRRGLNTVFFDPALQTEIASNVSTDRRLSLDNPLTEVTHNKIQALGQYFVKKYISNFEPFTLFVSGEPNLSPFSVWSKGFFHLIDLPLLMLGLYLMAARKKQRPVLYVWGVLFLIMPLPRLLTTVNDWMIFRGSIGYMLLLLPIAHGLHYFLTHAKVWLVWLVASLYILFIALFVYDYFYRYPIYSTNGFYFEQRVMASYLARQPAETSATVYTQFPEFLYYSYLYYNQLVTAENLPIIRENLRNNQYALENILFTEGCVPALTEITGIAIVERTRPHCLPADLPESEQNDFDLKLSPINALSISSPLDSGEIFWIFNNRLCDNGKLTTFVDINRLEELAVEKLADQQFCELWIKNLDPIRAGSSH
jgi:hypothetical protein